MSIPRRLATRLLLTALRHSSPEGQNWARAMLREMDFIGNDWAALSWALGGSTAIFKYIVRGWRAWFGHSANKEGQMDNVGKKTAWAVLGIVIAFALAFGAFGLLQLSFHFIPSLGTGGVPWLAWLVVIVLPETIFVIATIRLWQKRRPMAIGILLSAVVLATHFIMHIANHLRGQ